MVKLVFNVFSKKDYFTLVFNYCQPKGQKWNDATLTFTFLVLTWLDKIFSDLTAGWLSSSNILLVYLSHINGPADWERLSNVCEPELRNL